MPMSVQLPVLPVSASMHLVPISETVPDMATCLGPGGGLLWPCALPPFHTGDHLRLSREHVLASVRALRAERDELRSCLLIARPLLADVDMVRGGALRRSLIARIDAAIAR